MRTVPAEAWTSGASTCFPRRGNRSSWKAAARLEPRWIRRWSARRALAWPQADDGTAERRATVLTERTTNMKWAWKLGEVSGIRSMCMPLSCSCWAGWRWFVDGGRNAGRSGRDLLHPGAFTCVVLHEFGHQQRPGSTGSGRDITLLPIGGVARWSMPENPSRSCGVAGPMVNLVIAAVLLAWLGFAAAFES